MSKPAVATTGDAVLNARAEASAWITRLHGPNRSLEMEAGFRRWLDERPENAEEFEGLTEIWDLVGAAPATRGATRLERWEHSAEARELQRLHGQFSRRHHFARPAWTFATLVLLACGLLGYAAYSHWGPQSYSTEVGEQRTLQLSDGSRVALNSATRVVIGYSNAERRVQLKRGEAFFEVAHDAERAFIVAAGDRRVKAIGTAFVVRHEPDRTAVTLVEGSVTVASPTATEEGSNIAAPQSDISKSKGRELSATALDAAPSDKRDRVPAIGELTLTPGQRVTFARNSVPVVDVPRLEAVTGWRRGEVILDDVTLAEAASEMNRYDKTSLVIDDPTIGELTVSGLYHTGSNRDFAHSVAKMHGLQVVQANGRIHLSRSRRDTM